MSRTYIPPSKRKEIQTIATIDPETLSNITLFPSLGSEVATKSSAMQFKKIVEDRLKKEEEENLLRLDKEKNRLERNLLAEGEFDTSLDYTAMTNEELEDYGLVRLLPSSAKVKS